MSITKQPDGTLLYKDDLKENSKTTAKLLLSSAKGKKPANLSAKEKDDLLMALAFLAGLIDSSGNII